MFAGNIHLFVILDKMVQIDDIPFPGRCYVIFLFKFPNLVCQGGFTRLYLILGITDMVMIPYFSTLTSLGFFDIKKDARGERDGGGAG